MSMPAESLSAFGTPENLERRMQYLEGEVTRLRETQPRSDQVTLLVFSADLDKLMAALMIATTAAAMDMKVTAFFTFWGLNTLKKQRDLAGKPVMQQMIDLMTPTGPSGMGVSHMNMLGAGAFMLKQMMQARGVVSAEELLQTARDSGVRLIACSVSMDVMGIRKDELMDGIEVGGAATYVGAAARSGITLFI
jgi:peroxiredoxin family protein